MSFLTDLTFSNLFASRSEAPVQLPGSGLLDDESPILGMSSSALV